MELSKLVPGRTYRVTVEHEAPSYDEPYDAVRWTEERDMVFEELLDLGQPDLTPVFDGLGGWAIVNIEDVA